VSKVLSSDSLLETTLGELVPPKSDTYDVALHCRRGSSIV
jgi:hypothetical protein